MPNVILLYSQISISAAVSYKIEWGWSVSETKTKSVTREIVAPPRCEEKVMMLGRQYTTDIPYTADLDIFYSDGSHRLKNNIEGTYRGVTVSDTEILYEETSLDCPSKKHCG